MTSSKPPGGGDEGSAQAGTGGLSPQIKPEPFARYLSVILAGIAVQASGGATLPELKRTVAMFRKTMPIPMERSSFSE